MSNCISLYVGNLEHIRTALLQAFKDSEAGDSTIPLVNLLPAPFDSDVWSSYLADLIDDEPALSDQEAEFLGLLSGNAAQDYEDPNPELYGLNLVLSHSEITARFPTLAKADPTDVATRLWQENEYFTDKAVLVQLLAPWFQALNKAMTDKCHFVWFVWV